MVADARRLLRLFAGRVFGREVGDDDLAPAEGVVFAALDAGSEFHITRGVWSYIEDKSFIEKVRAKGWEFQGSLCMTLVDHKLALQDREGKPIGTNAQSVKPPFRGDNANPD